jgi:hypothetical protein
MQIEELYGLTEWIDSAIVKAEIVQKYQQLHGILEQNSRPNQQKQPFEEQKNKLIAALSAIPLDKLSAGQIGVLRELGIADDLGSSGVAVVEDVLYRNAIDIANAAQQINERISRFNEAVQWAQQEKVLLDKILSPESITISEGMVLLRVRFAGEASVDNLTELRDWSKTWWEIGRGLSMANDQSPEAISVVGASKGSIVLSLLATYGIAKSASGIILSALRVAEKYYDIKRKAQEVRALEIQNNEAEKALEKAAEEHKKAGVEEIVKETIKELGLEPTGEGDKVTALTSATRKLVDFVTKGGEVDFVKPDGEAEEPEDDAEHPDVAGEELRVRFQEIRKLERQVRQLEDKRP